MSVHRHVLTRSLLVGLILLSPALSSAQSVTAHWDASPAQEGVTSYDVCISSAQPMTCDDVNWRVPSSQTWFTFNLTRGTLHLVTVRAVSGRGTGAYAPAVGVSAPRLAPIGDRSSPTGESVSLGLSVTDPDGSRLTFSATNLPPGLSIDGSGRIVGTPTATGTFRPNVTVTDSIGSDTQSFVWTITTGTGSNPGAPMTGISLSFSAASPQPAGTSVVLTAQGQGGSGTPSYRFWVQPWGGSWQIVQDWSTSSTVTWRPPSAGGYNLSVHGRTSTSSSGDVSANRMFEATAGGSGGGGGGGGGTSPMTSVALSFSPSSPQAAGTNVVLSAQGQGGSGTPSYRFWVQPWGGAWQIVQDWSTSSTVTWRPPAAGGYNLSVHGRTGSSGDGDVNSSRTFVATTGAGGGGGGGGGGGTSPMTSVALSFSPSSPQPAGTNVVLSAQGQGGSGTPSYRFWVQPWGGAWQIVQDWSTSSTVTWRPPAAGGYNLSVHGRTGSTGNGDVSSSRTFEATSGGGGGGGGGTSPLTSIALSFSQPSPQPAGTSVVLTAQAQGGSGTRTYRFWVQPWGGAWQILQDWSTSSTVTWRPPAAGGYNLSVHGRTSSTGSGEVSSSRTFEVRR